MNSELEADDVKDLEWAVRITGLTDHKLAKLAKNGLIPGAFNLSRSSQGWRFSEPKFMAWLREVSQKGIEGTAP